MKIFNEFRDECSGRLIQKLVDFGANVYAFKMFSENDEDGKTE